MPHHIGDVITDASTAVITGDPDRIPRLAEVAGDMVRTWSRRGFTGAEILVNDMPVLIASGGIGGPSTAILVEELGQLGVRQVVRVGTCGSLQPTVRVKDLVVPSGSVRDDGTSGQYLPPEVPAVPSHSLVTAIVAAAKRAGATVHVGITHCKDAYYVEKPAGLPLASHWTARWAMLRTVGVLATEMEAAALFAVAAVRRIQAAAILVPVDNSVTAQETLSTLQSATGIAITGALACLQDPTTVAGPEECEG